MSFASLGLDDALVRAVAERGYTEPTPIQTQAIPAILSGGDLLAGAQTGTGKTAGFTLPILQLLSQRAPAEGTKSGIRALILTPTRELAAQVEESVREYGKNTNLKSMVMFGGVAINPQIKALKGRIDILVATPGRLLDHVSQKTVDLSHIEILVLDEADRMLDMGFVHDIKKVLALLPAKRQNLLFSATFSDEIKALADKLLDKPALIEVARRNATAETIAQRVHPVDRDKKRQLLAHLIKQHNWFQVLVFTRTKHGANRLAEQLDKDGITSLAIHGNKSQGARTRALSEFKAGTLQVLVATDIAARGIDIDELPHVVNYELPNVPEDYVHRIGRTGRAGAEGEAISLVCVDETKLLYDIERLIKREIPSEVIEGFEPDPTIKAEPIVNGRRGQGQGGQRQGQGQRQQKPRREGGEAGQQAKRPPRQQRPAQADGQPAAQGGAGAGQAGGQGGEAGQNRRQGQPRQGQGQGQGQRRQGQGQGQGARQGNGQGQGQARQGQGGQRQGGSGQGGNAQGRGQGQGGKARGDRDNRGNQQQQSRGSGGGQQRDPSYWDERQPTSNESRPVAALFDTPRRRYN
ncbi:ATP-dependent RNA helicase RhlE [Andreprevotia lacus DSM 23236]|jgi:ATP-dependent RNA helicase RhlE|uniref:ATP-dependent RNA helicase RhlE n=1 Tax=Andreprevotia lacus DSM 23236 TaxID=1121001 RepID=A0A1W1XYS0_9NEIS|nr:DEAD/DEAH box helicase [Andreprevotia lacus]SMC29042.1 ATP-dependent RNA helicase RhlE [Andreprevotia lacus DSM 23236]